jgi:hypothetical protein
MDPEVVLNQGIEIVLTYGPKLAAAVVVFIIGSWVVKLVV